MFSKYNRRFINASRYIYSIPKYSAKQVKVKTSEAHVKDRLSMQNPQCESIKSKHENHRPRSM